MPREKTNKKEPKRQESANRLQQLKTRKILQKRMSGKTQVGNEAWH